MTMCMTNHCTRDVEDAPLYSDDCVDMQGDDSNEDDDDGHEEEDDDDDGKCFLLFVHLYRRPTSNFLSGPQFD